MNWQIKYPFLLFFLFLIPIFVYWKFKRIKTSAIGYSSIHNLKKLKSANFISSGNFLVIFRFIALILMILALSRPQSVKKITDVITEGVDIILAIDTSGSMRAEDFEIKNKRVNRLFAVKDVVREFIKNRTNDRIGMVVFGEEAYTQSPLTHDHDVIINFLDHISIGMAGDATAIGSAIGVSVNRLKDLKAKSKLIILLTDGQNNSGDLNPKKAAEIAKKFNIKIYTIGAGTKGKAPFLVDSPFGQRYVYQKVNIDEETLTQIADITGAKYFRATDTKSLQDIYKKIDKLEKTKLKVKGYMEYSELFHLFLIPALAFLLLEVLLSNTLFLKIP